MKYIDSSIFDGKDQFLSLRGFDDLCAGGSFSFNLGHCYDSGEFSI
jgi:hypothetical protein